jgi:hypothetical protein
VVKHEGRYYVTGIVSASPVSSAEICDSQQYALFTKVAQYNSFISEKEAQFRPFGNADCNNDEDPSICQKPTTETPSKTEEHRYEIGTETKENAAVIPLLSSNNYLNI